MDNNDRNISDRIWNSYIHKFDGKYITFSDEIGICSIKLNRKLGFIQPYSIKKRQLVAVLTFRSGQHKTFFMKKIPTVGFISQNGDSELCIVFNEKDIKKFENILGIRKRRKLSDEQRKVLSNNMHKLRDAL